MLFLNLNSKFNLSKSPGLIHSIIFKINPMICLSEPAKSPCIH